VEGMIDDPDAGFEIDRGVSDVGPLGEAVVNGIGCGSFKTTGGNGETRAWRCSKRGNTEDGASFWM